MPNELIYALTGLLSYFVGAIPSGYILVKLKTGKDIRTMGSGNIGANGGNGATLTAGGIINWTQAFSAVPTDPVSGYPYAIRYTDCGANGKQKVYDVRWNVIKMSANDRLIVIGARPSNVSTNGGLRFVVPANLRTVD